MGKFEGRHIKKKKEIQHLPPLEQDRDIAVVSSPVAQSFLLLAAIILLATTIFWSVLGARVQLGNADQLANTYVLQGSVHQAVLPAQHTFLLKLPLFWLINALHASDTAFIVVTVACCVVTVGFMAFVLYRIVRRPVVAGLLYLLFASILLAVPPQPYPGALLPVNMAMLTTRNIEYVVYVLSIILTARVRGKILVSWQFWTCVMLTGLLVASDKLFVPLYIGSAMLAVGVVGIWRRELLRFALCWLLAATLGSALGYGLLLLFGRYIVHLAGGGMGPYSITIHIRTLLAGSFFAALNGLTNLGANPAFSAIRWQDVLSRAAQYVCSIGGLVFVVNFTSLVVLTLAARVMRKRVELPASAPEWQGPLVLVLGMSSAIAIGMYVLTNHYYPVDARYLTIVQFTFIMGFACVVRHLRLRLKVVALVGLLLSASVCSGVWMAHSSYVENTAALYTLSARDKLVASAMRQHRASLLVGNYWRVMPARQAAGNAFGVLPLSGCTQASAVLTNQRWSANLATHPFAYLLTLDGQSPNFPVCTLDQTFAAYGRPNQSVVIDGSIERPNEILLFYDRGAQPGKHYRTVVPSTVIPVTLDDFIAPVCKSGKTIMNVVAHQDDDLLFMNPDHLRAYAQGDCLRTVYLTAGDAGQNQLYWLGREKGSEAAYDLMDGPTNDVWAQRVVRVAANEYISIAHPIGNTRIALVFVRLPDGNPWGTGYAGTSNESLKKLYMGAIPSIQSVDAQSSYTSSDVLNLLKRLMKYYQPDEVDTQAPLNMGSRYVDHADHIATGRYTQAAYQQFKDATPDSLASIKYYIGYPVHGMPPNVFGTDYQMKTSIFFTFAHYDSATCTTFRQCSQTAYSSYLSRQYQYVPTH